MFPSTNLVFCEAPASRARTLSCQGTNLGFRSTNSKDINPSKSEAPTPRALTLSCQCMFDSNSLLPKYSSLNFVYLRLHCYISDNLSSYEGVFTTLHISQT